jgi:hypothetical protein
MKEETLPEVYEKLSKEIFELLHRHKIKVDESYTLLVYLQALNNIARGKNI